MNYWNSLVTYSNVGTQKFMTWYSAANEMFDSVVNGSTIGTFEHLKCYWMSLFLVIRYAALYVKYDFKELDTAYYDFIQKHLGICDKMAGMLMKNKLSHRLIQSSEAHVYFLHTLLLRDIRKEVDETRNPPVNSLYLKERNGTGRRENPNGFVDICAVCPMIGEMVCYGFITMYYINLMLTAISQMKPIAASTCFKKIRGYFAQYLEKQKQVSICATDYMQEHKILLWDYFCFDMSEFSFVDKSTFNTVNFSIMSLFQTYVVNVMVIHQKNVDETDAAVLAGTIYDVDGVFPYIFVEDLK